MWDLQNEMAILEFDALPVDPTILQVCSGMQGERLSAAGLPVRIKASVAFPAFWDNPEP